uniref:Keratin n=1 Tax=Malurus cyaneus samueli TaxID=2593467 RepID=A0A8C5X8H0_9PASS
FHTSLSVCMSCSSMCVPSCLSLRVAVPQPVADSCNEPCVRQCPDSTVVIYPPPVVVTFPGPILSTFPQQSAVGSAGVPEIGAGAGACQVYGGAKWGRGYPVGTCRPC